MYRMKAKGNKAAEIYIYEDVGEGWFGGVSAKRFAEDLKGLGEINAIDVRINSYGGDVFDGLAIYRLLVDHKADVTVHVDGIAASIASIITMAGNEIIISDAGFLMIHEAWTMAVGDAAALRQQADQLDAVTEQLANVYVKRTGKTAGQVRDWMKAETWFNAADAVAHGFASRVAENQQMAARLDPAKHKFRRAPEALTAAARPDYDNAAAQIAALKEKLSVRSRLAQHSTRGAG